MTTRKSRCVTVRLVDKFGGGVIYRLRWKRLVGKKTSVAIRMVERHYPDLRPPFKVDGLRVRRNSPKVLDRGHVLQAVWW